MRFNAENRLSQVTCVIEIVRITQYATYKVVYVRILRVFAATLQQQKCLSPSKSWPIPVGFLALVYFINGGINTIIIDNNNNHYITYIKESEIKLP